MIPYSPQQWFRLLVTVRGSSSRGVGARVLVFGAIATAVVVADMLGATVHLPAGVHETSGVVIAVMLTFRTNTAYTRFWEARSLWGTIVNASRNLANVANSHVRTSSAECTSFLQWIVTLAWVTRRRLRNELEWPEVRRLLGDDAVSELAKAPNASTFAARQLSTYIARWDSESRLSPMMSPHAQQLVAGLVDAVGGCERIAGTPIPLGHVLLIERFLALYLATLPFMLVTRVEALTPLVTVAIAYPLLLLDALGAELESPFGHEPNHLPLSRICARLHTELLGTAPDASDVFAPASIDPDAHMTGGRG